MPNYELPSNIPGLTFTDPLVKAQELSTCCNPSNDVVIAPDAHRLHRKPKSVEVDEDVDTNLAAQVTGWMRSSAGTATPTRPAPKRLQVAADVRRTNNDPVIINQAYRYNNFLGEVVLGFLPSLAASSDLDRRSRPVDCHRHD